MIRFCLIIFLSNLVFIFDGQSQKPSNYVSSVDDLKKIDLPNQNNQKLYEKELQLREKGRPNYFATPIEVAINPKTHGSWESVKSGFNVWRLRIKSEDAKSLNLGFNKYNMPSSGQLFIYNVDKSIVLGPFSKADNDDHLQLWTPIIKTDEIIIELKISPNDIPKLELELAYVNHDFIGFDQINSGPRSGSCNLDVVCGEEDGFPEVDQYRDIIQSAAMYHINGISICSGALINNTANDCTPYFLTAQHCGIRPNNSASLVVYWNHQNSVCRQPNSNESGLNGDGMLNQFNSGCDEVAEFDDTDMSLVLLDDPIPLETNPFLAGWSRKIEIPPSAIGIHHPGVEEKRISFENDSLLWTIAADPSLNANGDTSWIIVEDWDLGTTEGGSSGSPLFNDKKQIIGQLFGGFAACGNDLHDYYGLIGTSWEGGGTPSTQLKHWLDPLGTDPITLDGLNCAYFVTASDSNFELCEGTDEITTTVTVSTNFTQVVQLGITSSNPDIAFTFDQDIIQSGESTLLTISNLNGSSVGSFDLELTADDGINIASSNINVSIKAMTPDIADLITPENNNLFVSNSPRFEWMNVGDSYKFQLSDNNFDDLLVDQIIDNDNFFNIDFLEEKKEYFWRVKTINICGESEFSEIYKFTVGIERCFKHHVLNLPVVIPETPQDNIADIQFDFNNALSITDVEVDKIRGQHSFIGDLRVTLFSENFNSVLLPEICQDSEDFDCGFSDFSTLDGLPCPPTDGRVYQPFTPLGNLRSSNTNEDWGINFQDNAFLDGGLVEEVIINYCFTGVDGPVILTASNLFTVCESDSYNFTVYAVATDLDSEIELVYQGVKVDISIVQNMTDESQFEITIDDFSLYSNGLYEFQLFTEDRTVEYPFLIQVLDSENLSTAQMVLPEPESTIEPDDLGGIRWTIDDDFNFFRVEIATDENFQNIIFSELVNGTSIAIPSILEIESKYHVKITTIGSCSESSDEFIFYTTGYTAVEDINRSTFSISPNPFLDFIEIQNKDYVGDLIIKLVNSEGKIINNMDARINSKLKIDLSHLNAGIYFIEITAENEKSLHRIIKVY